MNYLSISLKRQPSPIRVRALSFGGELGISYWGLSIEDLLLRIVLVGLLFFMKGLSNGPMETEEAEPATVISIVMVAARSLLGEVDHEASLGL